MQFFNTGLKYDGKWICVTKDIMEYERWTKKKVLVKDIYKAYSTEEKIQISDFWIQTISTTYGEGSGLKDREDDEQFATYLFEVFPGAFEQDNIFFDIRDIQTY